MSATHHPQKPTATATDAAVADHRPNGRPVGTYTTTRTGAQRRLWRQHGRDGIRLVDVASNGRGRCYLIERALTAGKPKRWRPKADGGGFGEHRRWTR
jgi:hypothetical protein